MKLISRWHHKETAIEVILLRFLVLYHSRFRLLFAGLSEQFLYAAKGAED